MAKTFLLRIQLIEEIPTRKDEVFQERIVDGCEIEFDKMADGQTCFDALTEFLQEDGQELLELENG